jgi:hypothetical protein
MKRSGYVGMALAAIVVLVAMTAIASIGSWSLAVTGDHNAPAVGDTYTPSFLMADAPVPGEPRTQAATPVEARTAEDVPTRLRNWQYTDGDPSRGS